jgi:hypothetical protein
MMGSSRAIGEWAVPVAPAGDLGFETLLPAGQHRHPIAPVERVAAGNVLDGRPDGPHLRASVQQRRAIGNPHAALREISRPGRTVGLELRK